MAPKRRIGLECCACGQFFTSDSVFRKHRVGSYGDAIYDNKCRYATGYTKSERRCLNEQEMLNKKMTRNDKGIWTTGEFDASVFEKAAQSSLVDTSAY